MVNVAFCNKSGFMLNVALCNKSGLVVNVVSDKCGFRVKRVEKRFLRSKLLDLVSMIKAFETWF